MVGTIRVPVDKRKGKFVAATLENEDPTPHLTGAVASVTLPGERWRIIPDTDIYAVSDHGRVFSVWTRTVLKAAPNTWGHRSVVIVQGGRRATKTVHKLVALAFVPNPHEHPLVRHVNDDKEHNTPANLAWGTPADNNNDHERNSWFKRVDYLDDMARRGIRLGSINRARSWELLRGLIVIDPSLYRPSLSDPWP